MIWRNSIDLKTRVQKSHRLNTQVQRAAGGMPKKTAVKGPNNDQPLSYLACRWSLILPHPEPIVDLRLLALASGPFTFASLNALPRAVIIRSHATHPNLTWLDVFLRDMP